ncbi:MAG TPA: type I restriction enzyme HsdR N-terminal domain-containing protein, partial [Desulfurivibrionaceae bacterium]|nr:type I restriction enzyme HsdR N-terminal domain-containing protein [Desulfurivibrionaceae bacterium]
DTDDERYRQKLARLLVEEKGYAKGDLEPRRTIETLFAGQFVVSKIDLVVSANGQRIMVIRYGPGSLVTRERPAIAAARVLDQERLIPLTVVTNGEDAELLDTRSGTVLATGLDAIPEKGAALALAATRDCSPLPESRREPELRILNAFDVEVCCAGGPCALPGAKEG